MPKPDVAGLKALAELVIKEWQTADAFKDIWNERGEGITTETVEGLLRFLLNAKKLDPSQIVATAQGVKDVITKVRDIQGDLRIERDGLFGRVTRNNLRDRLRGCPDHTEGVTELEESAKDSVDRIKSELRLTTSPILYFIEQSLAIKVVDGLASQILIREGWGLWQKHANIRVRQVDDARDANLIMRFGPIDRAGNTLGLAHVGGQNRLANMKLTLTLDDEESWNHRKFVAAICHEMGHILGLEHSKLNNQLMSPYLDVTQGIFEPRSEDIFRVRKEWGPPPTFEDVATTRHSEDILGVLKRLSS